MLLSSGLICCQGSYCQLQLVLFGIFLTRLLLEVRYKCASETSIDVNMHSYVLVGCLKSESTSLFFYLFNHLMEKRPNSSD